MKKLISLVIASALVIATTQGTFADALDENLNPSEMAEYAVNALPKADEKMLLRIKPVAPIYNEIVVNSVREARGDEIRVSRYAIGPATISISFSETISATYSTGLDASVEAKLFEMASAKVGVSIGLSLTASTSVIETQSFSIASGQRGAIYFYPRVMVASATYFDEYGNATDIIAKYPINVRGYADGDFYVKYE